MKKAIFCCLGILLLNACHKDDIHTDTEEITKQPDVPVSINKDSRFFAEKIRTQNLKKHLKIIASDAYNGRKTGYPGEEKALQYLEKYYQNLNIAPKGIFGYRQAVPQSVLDGMKDLSKTIYLSSYILYIAFKPKASSNIIAYIPGTEKKEEVIVISAHIDHMGYQKIPSFASGAGLINGADDNGSGTVAVMELARVFKEAKKAGKGTKRSLLFVHFTAEEMGLLGSEYYVNNPIIPLDKTFANINLDMVGRIDKKHTGNDNYVYVVGSARTSNELKPLQIAINKGTTQLELDFSENATNKVERSDNWNFVRKNIPSIFYHTGLHDDYHKATDDEEKINYNILTKITKLAFYTTWELANRNDKLKIDHMFSPPTPLVSKRFIGCHGGHRHH